MTSWCVSNVLIISDDAQVCISWLHVFDLVVPYGFVQIDRGQSCRPTWFCVCNLVQSCRPNVGLPGKELIVFKNILMVVITI